MYQCSAIKFIEATEPVIGLVTKFGGQPVWLEAPAWPVSESLGTPMQFIGQISIRPEAFGGADDEIRMMYLFIAEDPEGEAETSEPDSGDNAIIIQTGKKDMPYNGETPAGPALYKFAEGKDRYNATEADRIYCEYTTKYEPREEPKGHVDVDGDVFWEYDDEDEEEFSRLEKESAICKLGGCPWFVQGGYNAPEGDHWDMLVQLNSMETPFYLDFMDAGIGYLYVTDDYSEAQFFWESC